MALPADIGKKLRKARKAKGLSQAAVAKRAGVPQSHISRIETTGVDLRLSSLAEIARALDLELMLVPRKVVLATQSLIRQADATSKGPPDADMPAPRPAYALDDDDG